ncbi:hypothetical protein CDAR_583971 [Caerostris darwini]|uniref:C2H2-type domain-containing protein n=1 Tax=Caerostris darwini TaxID=1538125 RepID=A0AAV4SAX1_9ARAC|nr:hypothetical protein CDAR_583971 [Caerostris darwini]
MEIRNCEFCNAYVTNFEVHNCGNFGNQYRRSYATLSRSSHDTGPQDIDTRTQQIHYEERTTSMIQTNSSWQPSLLPNMHQRTHCQETASAEMSYPYGVGNQNPYNPETLNFPFPHLPHNQENQSYSTHLQQPSEESNVIMHQNAHCCEAWNPNQPAYAPLPIAEPCFVSGFQPIFGQRNPLMNQMAHRPNTSSQIEFSRISRTEGASSHFTSDFNESGNAWTNRISQQCETSSGLPMILDIQNAQYNPMDTIPSNDSIGQIYSNKYPKEFLREDNLHPHDRSRSVVKPYECNFCRKAFSNRYNLTDHIRTHTGEKPHACTICNKGFAAISNLNDHMHIHSGRPYKCKKCSECFVNRLKLRKHVQIIHNGQNSYKCFECSEYFVSHYRLRKHIYSIHTAVEPYKCTECSKCFLYPCHLREHVCISHTADDPYKCTECGKCLTQHSSLRRHIRGVDRS